MSSWYLLEQPCETFPWCASVTCQVLASLAYSQSARGANQGIRFVDPAEWVQYNIFSSRSIWDIPLVKPRFGCAFDTALSARGYDMAAQMKNWVKAFRMGAKCDLGFKEVQLSALQVKTDWEFGPEGGVQDVPDIRDFRVSVIYFPLAEDAKMLNISIATVVQHFPNAFEVVLVVADSDAVALFEGIVDIYRTSANFPLRIIEEPQPIARNIQREYGKVRCSSLCDVLAFQAL